MPNFIPGQSNPAPLQAFRLNIEPGAHAVFDGYGDFAYIAEASGPLELAIDDNTNFFPWDVALALEYAPPNYFRRIAVKNASDQPLTGILYTGYARITDHRTHNLGEQKVSFQQTAVKNIEGTLVLNDTAWHVIAAPVEQKREVWLAVERADNDADAPLPVAWWRGNTGEETRVATHEIGLALDGITRLPFSGTVAVATNAPSGTARIRHWIVTEVPENQSAETAEGTDNDEVSVLPVLTSNAPHPELTLSQWHVWDGDAVLWRAFDADPATMVGGGWSGGWELWLDMKTPKEISRVIIRGNPRGAAGNVDPAYSVDIGRTTNGNNPKNYIISKACSMPLEVGGVIFNQTFAEGEFTSRWVVFHFPRDTAICGIEIYTKTTW